MSVHLLIGDLPGTAVPQLVHRRLVLEAVVQPEGCDQLFEPPDAARQGHRAGTGTACSPSCCEGLGVVGLKTGICAVRRAAAQAGLRGQGVCLLLRPGLLVDVRQDVDLVEAQAEFAQQGHDPVTERGTVPRAQRPAAEPGHPCTFCTATYAFLSSSILLICPPTNTRILHFPHRFLRPRR